MDILLTSAVICKQKLFITITRLCNILITINAVALTKVVLESPYNVLQRTGRPTVGLYGSFERKKGSRDANF